MVKRLEYVLHADDYFYMLTDKKTKISIYASTLEEFIQKYREARISSRPSHKPVVVQMMCTKYSPKFLIPVEKVSLKEAHEYFCNALPSVRHLALSPNLEEVYGEFGSIHANQTDIYYLFDYSLVYDDLPHFNGSVEVRYTDSEFPDLYLRIQEPKPGEYNDRDVKVYISTDKLYSLRGLAKTKFFVAAYTGLSNFNKSYIRSVPQYDFSKWVKYPIAPACCFKQIKTKKMEDKTNAKINRPAYWN